MVNITTGGCLCGKIRYEISHALHNIIACHCTNCQKSSGSGMSHNTLIPTSAFKLVSGKPKVFLDKANSGNKLYRAFCADCGSPIYSQREHMPEMMIVKVGTLDNSDAMKIAMNIWTKSARPWLSLAPDIEHYAENRPAKS